MPDADWKWNYYTNAADVDRQWKGGDFTNLAIGQGDLLVTPIQMLCAYAGIATGGSQWRPHVLRSIHSRTGTGSVIDYEPQLLREVHEDPAYLSLVLRGLQGAIYEESEWIALHFNNMKERVAGKSGTGEQVGKNPTAWYIAFAPAQNPRYAVVSTIEDATWASGSALYVTRDVLGALFGEPDDALVAISDMQVAD